MCGWHAPSIGSASTPVNGPLTDRPADLAPPGGATLGRAPGSYEPGCLVTFRS
jgi:hypothetical protein